VIQQYKWIKIARILVLSKSGNLLAGQMSGRQKAGRKVIFRCCRTIKEADANANARVIKFSNKNQNQNQELHNPQRQEERGSGSARELQTVWFGFGLGLGLVFGPLHRRTSGLTDGLTDGQTDGQTFASWKPGQKTEDSDWAAVVVVIYGSFALRLQHQQQTEKLVKK